MRLSVATITIDVQWTCAIQKGSEAIYRKSDSTGTDKFL